MDWWVKDLAKIIRVVAKGAESQEGKVIKCSSVALHGWADGIEQLEAKLKELEGMGTCFWCEETFTNEVSDEEISNHYKTCVKHPVFQLEVENARLKQELLNERVSHLGTLHVEDRITTAQYDIAIEELKTMDKALQGGE